MNPVSIHCCDHASSSCLTYCSSQLSHDAANYRDDSPRAVQLLQTLSQAQPGSIYSMAYAGDDEADRGHAGAGTSTGAAVAGKGSADWWLGAIDLLVRNSPSQGDSVADFIKEQLMERDR